MGKISLLAATGGTTFSCLRTLLRRWIMRCQPNLRIQNTVLLLSIMAFAGTRSISGNQQFYVLILRRRWLPQSERLVDWRWKDVTIPSSVPYAHWQNAVERDVQTIVNGTSTLIHSQPWLPADCRDLPLFHFVDIRNRAPNKRTGDKSPHEPMITKEALNYRTRISGGCSSWRTGMEI